MIEGRGGSTNHQILGDTSKLFNFCETVGTFFLPADQQHDFPASETNYEGLAYLGEYPLAWAACTANETIYNLLLDKGADPDAQDSFGNTVLHMVVVTNQMVKSFFLLSPVIFTVCFSL